MTIESQFTTLDWPQKLNNMDVNKSKAQVLMIKIPLVHFYSQLGGPNQFCYV